MIRRLALLWLAALWLSACGLQDFCVNVGSGCPPAKAREAEPQKERGEP